MPTQELMGANQRSEISGQLRREGLLYAFIGGRVAFLLGGKSKSHQHAQAVGTQGKHRQFVVEQQDLLGRRFADGREQAQIFPGRSDAFLQYGGEVISEELLRDVRRTPQFFCAVFRHDPPYL